VKATFDADFSALHTEAVKADADMGKLAQSAAEVDKALIGMTSAQGKATSTSNSAVTSLRQFDGVLASVGLNINSQIRAIDDLAAASHKSASEIGALGTAGLVTGAAFAGWELGRTIANVFGLDDKVAHLTTSLFGLNDVQKETALAQQDTIDKASALAGHTLSYAEAVAFLTKQQKEATEAQKAFEAGTKALTEVGDGLNTTLKTIDGTVVEAIKFYLAAGVSQKDLAAAYGLTETQIRAVAAARKDDLELLKIQQDMDKVTTDLALQHQKQWRDEIEKTTKERNAAVIEGLKQIRHAETDLADFIAQQALSTTDYQIKKINDEVDAQLAAFDQTTGNYKVFAANILGLAEEKKRALIKKAQEAANAEVQAQIDAFNQMIAIIPDIGHGPTTPNGQGPAPIFVKPINVPSVFFGAGGQNSNSTLRSFDDGGPTGRGGPALLHPNEFVVPRGGALVSGGGMQITINVTQPLGTPTAIADAVADALAKQYRGRGVRS
jgi:hypothetical protein